MKWKDVPMIVGILILLPIWFPMLVMRVCWEFSRDMDHLLGEVTR